MPIDIPEYTLPFIETALPFQLPGWDESFWQEISPVFLGDCITGETPSLSTSVKGFWYNQGLVFRFYAEDTCVQSRFTKRDEPLYEEEVVEVFIAAGMKDPVHYYELEVSPFNIQWDGRIYNPTGLRRDMEADVSWDAESFLSEVKIVSKPGVPLPGCNAWETLLHIGFMDISCDSTYHPTKGDVFRANFLRVESAPEEMFLSWSPTLKDPADFHVPKRFGRLILG